MINYRTSLSALLAGLFALALASCTLGPDYRRPALDAPPNYKSATPEECQECRLGQDWWKLFGDDKLNEMADAALQANQNLKAAVARVLEAREAARAVKSQFFPTLTLNPSVTRTRTQGFQGLGSATIHNLYQIPLDLTYEVDIWGRVRRSFESSKALYHASVADGEVVRQTLLADLASGYFTLRSLDAQDAIVARNIDLYRRQVDLTESQFKAGMTDETAVFQARTLLDATLASEADIRRQRADQEHALAILLGRPPAAIALDVRPLDLAPPTIPAPRTMIFIHASS